MCALIFDETSWNDEREKEHKEPFLGMERGNHIF